MKNSSEETFCIRLSGLPSTRIVKTSVSTSSWASMPAMDGESFPVAPSFSNHCVTSERVFMEANSLMVGSKMTIVRSEKTVKSDRVQLNAADSSPEPKWPCDRKILANRNVHNKRVRQATQTDKRRQNKQGDAESPQLLTCVFAHNTIQTAATAARSRIVFTRQLTGGVTNTLEFTRTGASDAMWASCRNHRRHKLPLENTMNSPRDRMHSSTAPK